MWKLALVFTLGSRLAVADPAAGSCEAVAKQHAKATKLAAFPLPATCTPTAAYAPRLITSAGELACKEAPKLDFKKHALVVTSRSPSPAQVGLDVYDDGKVVTLVSRERAPCKSDPQPMPGPSTTFVYQLAAGTRTFAEGSCTVPRACPK